MLALTTIDQNNWEEYAEIQASAKTEDYINSSLFAIAES